jgi:hypothetical protein
MHIEPHAVHVSRFQMVSILTYRGFMYRPELCCMAMLHKS